MGRYALLAGLGLALLIGCASPASRQPIRVWTGPAGRTMGYFAGAWRGVAAAPSRRSLPPTAEPYVVWRVRLIGESLTDREHVAEFEERWYRRDRSVRCVRRGTMRFLDGTLVMRVQSNDCQRHFDELDRVTVSAARADSMVVTTSAGVVRYSWLAE